MKKFNQKFHHIKAKILYINHQSIRIDINEKIGAMLLKNK